MFDFMAIFSMSGQLLLFRFAAAVAIAAVHGLALAAFARALGDAGPAQDGRMSLNPLVHLHPVGLLTTMLFRIGWIMPQAVNPRLLRGGRVLGTLLLIALSLGLMLLFAWGLWALRPIVLTNFPGSNPAMAGVGLLETTARLSIWFVLVNLIPLPPFTTGLLLAALAPRLYARMLRHMIWISLALALIAFTGVPEPAIAPYAVQVERWLFR